MKNLFKHSIMVNFNTKDYTEVHKSVKIIEEVLKKYERDNKVSHVLIEEKYGLNYSQVKINLECLLINWMNIKNDLETVRLATGMNIVRYDNKYVNTVPKGHIKYDIVA